MQAIHAAPALPFVPALSARDSGRSVVQHLERAAIFQEYKDAFEATTGLPLALRATGTFNSPLHDSKRVNPFCQLMAGRNKTCANCLLVQQKAEEEARSEAKTFQCFAGLSEAAVPVRVGEQVLGHLQTGQVLLHSPSAAGFKAVSRQISPETSTKDTAAIKDAYFGTRVLTKSQFDSIVRLLTVFSQHLSSISNQVMVQESTAESPVVAKARAYIAEHFNGEISVGEVARAVNMSTFYFCKVFKGGTGLTFTDYLARLRVESVKQQMLNPHIRVSEAAFAAGFQSLSQFNRVFRRIAGESPSDYRDRVVGSTPHHDEHSTRAA
ncbi:MAG: PocR ligand-binding domain-containing protein [Candidatus Didemnitutus sp.]|nr:PocR ligand-binding domain-containing protein [Candidatus Didemnitutus sp.]